MGWIKNTGKNRGNFILFAVVIAGYLFFLPSRLWLPDMRELIEATPFYEKQVFQDYSVYLTKWDYAENQQIMEVIVEVESKDLLAAQLDCEAVERTSGELNTESVVEDREYLIIRITEIPERWKEISLHLKDDEGNVLGMYTNVKEVQRVARLDARSASGYQIDRLHGQIGYDTYRIQQKENEISALTEENGKLKSAVEEMKKKKYPTQDEAGEAAELIAAAESKYQTNEDTIEKRTEEIGELNVRTKELQNLIEELE